METNSLSPLKISVIIPNYNGSGTLRQCLEAVKASNYKEYECIVVDDASTDNSVKIAKGLAIQVIELSGGPSGPAHARNLGAQTASGDIIFFVDADVVIYPDTLQKIVFSFTGSSELVAVFGSYDDQPGDGNFLSQYKNLFHHFVHQQASENSNSFWSGCGAIRRDIFLEFGGFDTLKYPRPSIEDIELGRRLVVKGYKILINKMLQVKHLKRWTLSNLVKTDIFDRGIPWTQLVIADRKIPNDLNLESSQRWSALVVGALLMFMAASAFFHHQVVLLPVLLCLFWFMLQCWQWNEQPPKFKVDWRSFLKISFFFVLFLALSLWLGFVNYLPSLLILLVIVVVGTRLTKYSQLWRQVIFSLMMIDISVVILQIVIAYPPWLIMLVALLLAIFVLFNRSFYAFFKQKRGVMFAVAVIPFHMLYFLYSMVAFVLGTLIYYYRKFGLPFFAEQARGRS